MSNGTLSIDWKRKGELTMTVLAVMFVLSSNILEVGDDGEEEKRCW